MKKTIVRCRSIETASLFIQLRCPFSFPIHNRNAQSITLNFIIFHSKLTLSEEIHLICFSLSLPLSYAHAQ